MTRRMTVLPTIFVVITGAIGFGPGATASAQRSTLGVVANPIAFTDSFDNGRSDGWRHRDQGTIAAPSSWRVSNGRLIQSSNIYGGSSTSSSPDKAGTLLIAGDSRWTDYDYTVRAKTTDNDAFGIVFRYQGPDDYYRFSMDAQRNYRQLVKRVNGRTTVLAQRSLGYTPGDWYSLRAIAVGDRLQVLVDGALVFDVIDSSLPTGKFGLYTWGCPTTFDSVSAQVGGRDHFTVAVVPDTQYEVRSSPSQLAAQMTWLAKNRAALNLATVLHEGDVVDTMNSSAQWATAAKYLHYLDGVVPYSVAAGNHDIMDFATLAPPYPIYSTRYDQLIAGLANYRIDGRFKTDSALDTYRILDAGGVRLLILNLEFGARDDVLAWAGHIVDRYADRHVIMLTHDYLGSNNQVRGPDVEGGDNNLPSASNPSLNDGVDMWAKFVKVHANVQFTFNGHVIDPTSPTERWSVGRLLSDNDAGRTVYQTLTNYQTYNNGGGFLRLFRFYPAIGNITVTSYSPAQNTYLRDDDDEFAYSDVDLGDWAGSAH